MCKALAGSGRCSVGSRSVVTIWLSGKTEADEVALWLTMLPCDASRGRFGDSWMVPKQNKYRRLTSPNTTLVGKQD
eukprot:scaffold4145_cov115-Isochrysis_galbana.AAC.1